MSSAIPHSKSPVRRRRLYLPRRMSPSKHAWICDGYRRTKVLNKNGAVIAVWTQLHMNWGMNGFFNETWYAENNWKSNDGDYNYNKMIIYGIKPKK